MFMNRPEEPTEWAGLPSEPWEPGPPAGTLGAGAAPDALALVAGDVASVSIPVSLPEHAPDEPTSAEEPPRR
nr:hypothetical protein [Microbacterium pullorum]